MSTLPLTYPDLVCVLDLDPNASETTSDLANLTQDIFHVLIELLSSNPDDPDRGVGIDQYLSGTLDDLAKVPRLIENQLDSDDRIDAVSASLVQNAAGSEFPFTIAIDIGVNGSVLGLQYGWTSNGGLVPLAPVGGN